VNGEGQVTKYEYDNQSRVKTVLYPWSGEKAETDRREAEEAGLYFTPDKGNGERYTLTGSEVTALRNVLSLAGPGRGNAVSGSRLVWRESYTYDGNGNRAGKSTPWGTIAYTYDAENRLVSKGTIRYVYDADGNLVREQGPRKEASYQYSGRNRMEYAEVTDAAGGERVRSEYRYDGLGRRTLAGEEGGETLRVLYDGMSFEAVREGPSYRDGQLTGRSASGQSGGAANTGTGQPNTATGERYRWLSEGEAGRTRGTETAAGGRTGRYEGIKVTLYGNGEAVAVSRSTGSGSGPVYLGKDIVGSVRSTTNGTGALEERYEYDVFGTPYRGDLTGGMNLGYTGKPYDAKTGLYDYGYRDYQPGTARFTTADPVRDGSNWFAYVNNDPVNWVDPWGLVKNETNHAVYVVYEDRADNGKYGQLLAPGQTYKGNGSLNDEGRVDGVIAYDARTGVTIRKVSDSNDSRLPPIKITVRQDKNGKYSFHLGFGQLTNLLGDAGKKIKKRDDPSGTFYNDQIANSPVESWLKVAKEEYGDPSTWDSQVRRERGCNTK
jgi:RHS repeat-associated protein